MKFSTIQRIFSRFLIPPYPILRGLCHTRKTWCMTEKLSHEHRKESPYQIDSPFGLACWRKGSKSRWSVNCLTLCSRTVSCMTLNWLQAWCNLHNHARGESVKYGSVRSRNEENGKINRWFWHEKTPRRVLSPVVTFGWFMDWWTEKLQFYSNTLCYAVSKLAFDILLQSCQERVKIENLRDAPKFVRCQTGVVNIYILRDTILRWIHAQTQRSKYAALLEQNQWQSACLCAII